MLKTARSSRLYASSAQRVACVDGTRGEQRMWSQQESPRQPTGLCVTGSTSPSAAKPCTPSAQSSTVALSSVWMASTVAAVTLNGSRITAPFWYCRNPSGHSGDSSMLLKKMKNACRGSAVSSLFNGRFPSSALRAL